MKSTLSAIYEHGALHPLEKLKLNEGEIVTITVESGMARVNPRKSCMILSAIAKLSKDQNGEKFSGADHDQILYPGKTEV